MVTTTKRIHNTFFTTKTIESGDVIIGVTRRIINFSNMPKFVSELEYSLEYKKFKKTMMCKRSFDFHLQMIKDGMFEH